MKEISTLTIKIPLDLKEKIKAIALENQLSLSAEVCQRLEDSLAVSVKSLPQHEDIDNQDTVEKTEQPLSQKELKKLRQLLKSGIKSNKKK
ncbi:hypothetical protein C9426_21840 [Serratia sp. S1B]|nr:hypothetical protein C9426_21840 [Serratia sp. S1B]